MAKLKPYIVGEYRHRKTGLVVPIMYDREQRKHYASVGPDRFEDAAYGPVLHLVQEATEKAHAMVWFPVIEVSIDGSTDPFMSARREDRAGLTLCFSRSFLSVRTDGENAQCDWSVTDSRTTVSNPREWKDYEGFEIPDEVKLRLSSVRYRAHREPVGKTITPDTLPYIDRKSIVMVYSEARWNALCAIGNQIKLLKESLLRLVSSNEGMAMLESLPQLPTLSAPSVHVAPVEEYNEEEEP